MLDKKKLNHEGHEEHEVKSDKLTNKVIGCAKEVHRAPGPGLLESNLWIMPDQRNGSFKDTIQTTISFATWIKRD